MNKATQSALDSVNETYADLAVVVDNICKRYTLEVDGIISYLKNNIESLSNEDIRKLMVNLATTSYSFSETKEYSVFKSALSESIRKEVYAKQFNLTEGTVAVRENTALINSAGEIIADEICQAVASTLKTKADEIHRVVDALKTVLLSRQTEAKLVALGGE